MKIYDKNDNLVMSPDFKKGYVKPDKLFVAHHEAVTAVEEVWHHEVIREYPNGGKDVARVIDTPAVEEKEAWDEYEDILRYTEYTEEELVERNKPTPQDDTDALLVDHEMRLTVLELGLN